MITKPNIVPCIAIELPPQALDVLILAMSEYTARYEASGVPTDDQDLRLYTTITNLLDEVRGDYIRKTA